MDIGSDQLGGSSVRKAWIIGLAAVALTLSGCGESSETSEATPVPATATTTTATTVPRVTAEPFTAAPTTTAPAPTSAARNAPAGSISEATWTSGEWPFTVPNGTLQCSTNRVTFTANRTIYALNGAAKSAGGFDDVAPIWADSSFPGVKVDLGPVINQGLSLC